MSGSFDDTREDKLRREKSALYYDVDAEEQKGAFRMSILFVLAGMVVLGVDLSTVSPKTEEVISLADVDENNVWTSMDQVHLVMDKCELLFIEDTEPWKDGARETTEPYILVQVPMDEHIKIVHSKSGPTNRRRLDFHVTNEKQPAYSKYEGFFCVIEWHYPKGSELPSTELELYGRHVSTITGGRCEICSLATVSNQPVGCSQPMPFEGNEADGRCSTGIKWAAGSWFNIWTADGHKTPVIVGLRNAKFDNITVEARAGGYVGITSSEVGPGGMRVTLPGSASANIELKHPVRADVSQKQDKICASDVSLAREEVAVVVEDDNTTNTSATSAGTEGAEGAAADGASADSNTALLALLASLMGGAPTATTAATTAADPAATVEDETNIDAQDDEEVEDLGRRRQMQQTLYHAYLEAEQRERASGRSRKQLVEEESAAGEVSEGANNISNASNVTTQAINVTNYTSTEYVVPLLDPSVLPMVTIAANKGVASVRGRGSSMYKDYVEHQSYFNELYGVVISDSDLSRLKTIFTRTEPVADIVNLRLNGRGSPYGSWRWHRDSLYSGYSSGFLAASSLGLLAPRITTIDIALERAFCSADDTDESQTTGSSISTGTEVALLKLHAVLAREINNLATEIDDNTYNGLPSASTPVGFRAWGADRFGVVTVGVDHRVGVLYLAGLSYGMADTKVWARTTFSVNLLVITLVGAGFAYLLISGYIAWWRCHLLVWGSSYFGPKWRTARRWPRVREQAGFFFMMEFLVAYPRQRSGMFNRTMTVVVDFCALAVPSLPILLVLMVSKHAFEGPMWAFTIYGAIVVMAQGAIGLMYLAANYLGLRWSLRQYLQRPFHLCVVVNTVTSCIIIANVGWWLIVGAALRPSIVLPSAVGYCALGIHIVLAIRRVQALAAQLPSESARAAATTAAVNAAMEALEEGVHEWHRRRAVKDAADTLGPLRVLEITGDSLRQVVHIELLWGFIFLLLVGPISLAHRAYGYHHRIAEATVAALAIAFLALAMQLARPLADGGLDGQRQRWEAIITRTAAEEAASIARIEAVTAAQALLVGEEGHTSSSLSDDSDLDGSYNDEPPGRVRRSAKGESSMARSRKGSKYEEGGRSSARRRSSGRVGEVTSKRRVQPVDY